MCVYECLLRPQEGVGFPPKDGVRGKCDLPRIGAGNQTFRPLEEQQVLSTTLPSFHPLICLSSWKFPDN